MNKPLILIFITLLLSGCTSIKAAIAMMRSTDHFVALDKHPSIRLEQGAEEYATLISKYADESIRIIQEKQGGFPKGVLVYVPNSEESFVRYCVNPVRACVIGGRLFMSPKLMREKKNIPKILTHELSHLQIQQYIGRWNAQLHIPGWFGEGLAVFVSNGGGADRVGRKQAMLAIKQGKCIAPEGSGGILFSHPPVVEGVGGDASTAHQMFYRQSAIYVEWLYTQSPGKFHEVIEFLHEGETLDEAMMKAYGFGAKEGWQRLVNEIET